MNCTNMPCTLQHVILTTLKLHTYSFHERAAHFTLDPVKKLVLVITVLVLEVDYDVHLN